MRLDPNSRGYFRCVRLSATLARASCGLRHRRTRGKLTELERLQMSDCMGCPTGRKHEAKLVPVEQLARVPDAAVAC